MSTSYIYILLACLISLPLFSLAQPETFDLRMVKDSSDQNNVYVTLEMKANVAPFKLGSTALFIDYNITALGRPAISQNYNYAGLVSNIVICPSGFCVYQPAFQISNTDGRTGIGINLAIQNSGAILPMVFTKILQLQFPVLNGSDNMALTWRGTTNAGVLVAPTVVKKDDEITNVFENALLGCPGSVFPVELLSFTATSLEQSIMLHWATEVEENSKGFVLERSNDQTFFQPIGFFDAKGTVNSGATYEFEDTDLVPNIEYYYRLRQVDLDGAEKFSNTVNGKIFSTDIVFVSRLYPTPSQNQAFLDISISSPQEVVIRMINLHGQEIFEETKTYDVGTHKIEFDLTKVAVGVYLVLVETEDGNFYREGVKL